MAMPGSLAVALADVRLLLVEVLLPEAAVPSGAMAVPSGAMAVPSGAIAVPSGAKAVPCGFLSLMLISQVKGIGILSLLLSLLFPRISMSLLVPV